MTLVWKHSADGIDWEELSALYREAPLGEKKPLHLQKVFSNSMFQCFVYENKKLVAVGRALADGADCSYICDVAVATGRQGVLQAVDTVHGCAAPVGQARHGAVERIGAAACRPSRSWSCR